MFVKKLRLSFEEIYSKLSYLSSIVEDSSLDEVMKNLIFIVRGGKVIIVGHNTTAMCRTELIEATYEPYVKEVFEIFQIKAKDFTNLCSVYRSSERTRCTEVVIEILNDRIRVEMVEEAIDVSLKYAQTLAQKSKVDFPIIPINKTIEEEICIDASDITTVSIVSENIRIYLNALSPLLSDDITMSSSRLYFSDKYVYAMPGTHFNFMVNNINGVFSNIVLTKKGVNLLTKFLTGNDVVEIGRNKVFIYIKYDNTECFIKYKTDLIDTLTYLRVIASEGYTPDKIAEADKSDISFINRNTGIMVDRLYICDVLSRAGVFEDDVYVEMDIDEKKMKVSNRRFSQDIVLLSGKGVDELKGLKFKCPVKFLLNSFLNAGDNLFDGISHMYFIRNKNSNKCIIIIMDGTGQWFNLYQVQEQR